MIPSFSKLSSLECESCQLGKHTPTSSKQLNKRASSLFSLVHSHIWGSSRVGTTFGFYYFVTLLMTILITPSYF